MLFTILIIWAVTSVLAFWMFIHDWRRKFNVDLGDALFLGSMSLLGPISLISALLVGLIGFLETLNSPIIWKRRS